MPRKFLKKNKSTHQNWKKGHLSDKYDRKRPIYKQTTVKNPKNLWEKISN